MLSYRHHFHAGNFADVFKHFVLTQLVLSLHKKDTPYCYLDTHAGSGLYDLHSAPAQKNHEYNDGILRLSKHPSLPSPISEFYKLVLAENETGQMRFYPGSPRIVRQLLRAQDRMILTELHPSDFPVLKNGFAKDKQVTVLNSNGYQALNALLPPKEKRGLVLCDPAFELKDERNRLIAAISTAYKKWATGMYAIWYPIQNRRETERLYSMIEQTGIRKILVSELFVKAEANTSPLSGNGMLIINPPWKFDALLNDTLPWLSNTLALDSNATSRVDWLVPE